MRCPFCEFTGHRRALHAHLATDHADRVVTKEGANLQLTYELGCPACATVIKRVVNPRNRDPRFLDDNATEIRLVAFDQLLYHLEDAHAEPATQPAEKE